MEHPPTIGTNRLACYRETAAASFTALRGTYAVEMGDGGVGVARVGRRGFIYARRETPAVGAAAGSAGARVFFGGVARLTIEQIVRNCEPNSYKIFIGRSLTKPGNKAVLINFYKQHFRFMGISQRGKSSMVAAFLATQAERGIKPSSIGRRVGAAGAITSGSTSQISAPTASAAAF